jgi:succinate dehydrogenase / fumarate reductase iron-sulfur subunit
MLLVPECVPRPPRARGDGAVWGTTFFVRVAGLEMHPLDSKSRTRVLKDELGIGLCNITQCCTEVCPEEIQITDNAIIPLKERVVDEFYDPLLMLVRKIRGAK